MTTIFNYNEKKVLFSKFDWLQNDFHLVFDLVGRHHLQQINVRVNYLDSNTLNTLRTVPVFVRDLFHSPNHTVIITDHLLNPLVMIY